MGPGTSLVSSLESTVEVAGDVAEGEVAFTRCNLHALSPGKGSDVVGDERVVEGTKLRGVGVRRAARNPRDVSESSLISFHSRQVSPVTVPSSLSERRRGGAALHTSLTV